MGPDSGCTMCENCPVESALHLIVLCPLVMEVRYEISVRLDYGSWYRRCRLGKYGQTQGNKRRDVAEDAKLNGVPILLVPAVTFGKGKMRRSSLVR